MKSKIEIVYRRLDEIRINAENEGLVPKTSDKRYSEIRSDVEINGIKNALTITENNEIIDGHTRYHIATELNLETVPTTARSYETKLEEKLDVIMLNLPQRLFNKFQLYDIAEKLLPIEEELSDQRIKDTLPKKGSKGTSKLQGDKRGETIEIVAKATGLGRTQVNKIKHISKASESNPEIAEEWTNYKNGNSKLSFNSIHKKLKEEGDEKSGGESEIKPEGKPEGDNVISGSDSADEVEEFEVDNEKLKLTLKQDVRERLDFYRNGSTTLGNGVNSDVKTYNEIIRYAPLRESGLWDNPDFLNRIQ
jgi:hypothetical protein